MLLLLGKHTANHALLSQSFLSKTSKNGSDPASHSSSLHVAGVSK